MLSDEHYKIRSEYVENSETPMEETLSSIKRVKISEDEAEPSWCNWSYVIWLENKLIEKEGVEPVEVAEDYLEDYCIESDLERQ